jgi:hypothetical protein
MEATAGIVNTSSFKRALSHVNWGQPLLLISLATLIILPGLGEGSLRDWDEAIYAQVSKEIVQSGDWITLYHGYKPFFEKPPLLMWIIAIFYKLFGVNEFWARMPSALSGILLTYVTYLTGKTIYGNRTGFLAGLILLTSYGFIFEARNGETDMLLSLFVFTGMFAYLCLRNGSQRWWHIIWGLFGLAFMVKFWAALIFPAVLLVTILLEGKILETLHSRRFWLGFLLAAMIVIPWHFLVYARNGMAFLNIYIIRDLLTRTNLAIEGHSGSPLFYLDVLRRFFSPWYFLFPFTLVLALKEMINSKRKPNLLIVEIILFFGLYTFGINTKNPSYIFPIYPAFAILTARLFILASSTPGSYAFIGMITAALLATTVAQDKLLVLGIFIGIMIVVLTETGLLPKKSLPQIVIHSIFVGFLLISVTGYFLGNHRLSLGPIYGMQASPVAQIAVLAGNDKFSAKDPLIGFALEQDWDTDFAVEGPTALFYSNRPIDVLFTWNQLEQLMSDRGSGDILIAEKYLQRISENYEITSIEKVDPLVYARFSR